VPRRKLISREDGEAYFDLWVGNGGQIVKTFARRMEAAGGPVWALTFEPASLPEVFGWACGRIRLVPGDVVDDGDLPPWHAAGPITSPFGDFDAESARWADGLSRYFGEVLIRHLPGVRWALADEPRYRDVYSEQWWPVIAGPLLGVNPLDAGGLAGKQGLLPADQRDIEWLLRNYHRYLTIVTDNRDPSREEPEEWQVGEIDHEPSLAEGWRYNVCGPEDERLDEARAEDLTTRLRSMPGVSDVDREDRTSWLVAGEVTQDSVEAVVRGWVRAARKPSSRRRTSRKRKP